MRNLGIRPKIFSAINFVKDGENAKFIHAGVRSYSETRKCPGWMGSDVGQLAMSRTALGVVNRRDVSDCLATLKGQGNK